jgi:hypothetical protein
MEAMAVTQQRQVEQNVSPPVVVVLVVVVLL